MDELAKRMLSLWFTFYFSDWIHLWGREKYLYGIVKVCKHMKLMHFPKENVREKIRVENGRGAIK